MGTASEVETGASSRIQRRRRRLRGARLGGVIAALLLVALWVFARPPLVLVLWGAGLDPRIPKEHQVAPQVHPDLREHGRLFERQLVQVGRVYCAVGYGLANLTFIEGQDGLIAVDSGESLAQAEEVLRALRQKTTKPIVALILTHHHADHVLGTPALLGEAPVQNIPIIAHESLVAGYAEENGALAELQTLRSTHMFGAALQRADREGANNGLGPFLSGGEGRFVPPTRTFGERLELTLAGVRLELRHVPSEAESELAVYLPDDRLLLSADIIQGPTFPNLYTLRGARPRDPLQWVRGIDGLRALAVDALIGQHGPPVRGAAEVSRVLTLYRDQIQFVHDQTIRYMNQGYAADEIAAMLRLPPALASAGTFAQEFYGTVKHAVPAVFVNKMGWFSGDPVALDPTPRRELARRLVGLMGGAERVRAETRAAAARGEDQYAAELATYLIRADPADRDAQLLKAAAFRRMGNAQRNAVWRSFYLVAAMELSDQIPEAIYLRRARRVLGEALRELPAAAQVGLLPVRLRAEEADGAELRVGLRFGDSGEAFLLHLRRGVLAIEAFGEALGEPPGAEAAAILTVTRESLGAVLAGAALADELAAGRITVSGDGDAARRLFGWLERPFSKKPEIIRR